MESVCNVSITPEDSAYLPLMWLISRLVSSARFDFETRRYPSPFLFLKNSDLPLSMLFGPVHNKMAKI